MTPATPRPWHVEQKDPGRDWRIWPSDEGDLIAAVMNPYVDKQGNVIRELETNHAESEANAALIVRAVNSHDALVAAVQAAREELGKRLLSEAICAKLDAALALATNGQEAG